MFGVWNTDDTQNLRLIGEDGRYQLEGRKILASGAGHIERPLVTARDEHGHRLIVMPHLQPGERADLSQWTAHGMRASATGVVDFSGIAVEPIEIVGSDGDYERQPTFSGGAWRFAAVHQGGMERLLDLLRVHLRRTGRGGDPHQAARLARRRSRQRRRGSGSSARPRSPRSHRRRSHPTRLSPMSISRVLRWSGRVWTSWNWFTGLWVCKGSCGPTRSNAFLAI